MIRSDVWSLALVAIGSLWASSRSTSVSYVAVRLALCWWTAAFIGARVHFQLPNCFKFDGIPSQERVSVGGVALPLVASRLGGLSLGRQWWFSLSMCVRRYIYIYIAPRIGFSDGTAAACTCIDASVWTPPLCVAIHGWRRCWPSLLGAFVWIMIIGHALAVAIR